MFTLLKWQKMYQVHPVPIRPVFSIKVLTALMERMSLSVGWINGPKWGLENVHLTFL